MSINSQNTYLNIEDAHLRLRTGNVYAQGINIGGITVDPAHGLQRVSDTGNVTSNTLQFANATTAFVTTANVTVGRDLTVTGNTTVSSNLTVTGNAVISDDLTVTENLLVSNNLTVTGNTFYTNPTSVLVNSNVVAEYTGPHDRPLRKYPEVELDVNAMTSPGVGGYIVAQSGQYSGAFAGWTAFGEEFTGTNAEATGGAWIDGNPGSYAKEAVDAHNGVVGSVLTTVQNAGTLKLASNTPVGAWVSLELPTSIKLQRIEMRARLQHLSETDLNEVALQSFPREFGIWGYDGSNWVLLKSVTGHSAGSAFGYIPTHVNATTAYNKYAIVVTRTNAVGGSNSDDRNFTAIGQLYFYGHEEGSGSIDTTLKSVYNVPAITGTQLEVYYDAKDLTAMPSTVTDLSPNSNGGSVAGATLDETGGIESFRFDGNDYISTTVTGLTGTSVTMSVWVNVNSIDTSRINSIVGLGAYPGSGSSIWIAIDGSQRFYTGISGLSKTVENSSAFTNNWVHLTMTIGTGELALYQDATIIGKVSGVTFNPDSNPVLYLGTRSDGSGNPESTRYFTGSIANFRLYSKALNADQIKELYDYQKDYFLGSKSQVTLYKGHLGVGVTEPSGQLELAGDERIQEYPPRALTGYSTHIEGHGVFGLHHTPGTGASGAVVNAFNKSATTADFWYSTIQVWTPGGQNVAGPFNYTGTHSIAGISGEWVYITLPYHVNMKYLQITARNGEVGSAPNSAIIIGSSDGGRTWEQVGSWSDKTSSNFWLDGGVPSPTFTINSTKPLNAIGFVVTEANSWYAFTLGEIKFFGTPGPTTLDKGSLSLTRSLDVPRVSRYDVDTETPRPEKLLVDFDTTVNDSPTDISGRGNHGVFRESASYSPADKAFNLDGTNKNIRAELNNTETGNQYHSVSLWFKILSGQSSNWRNIFECGENPRSGTSDISLYILGGQDKLSFANGGGHMYSDTLTNLYFQWHHIVLTYDGANRNMYLDGALIKTLATTSWAGVANMSLTLGKNNASSAGSEGCDCHISNFKLYWQTALEPSEVKKLYNLGRTGRSTVISDTAVGIGKVPDAQVDVRGDLRVGGRLLASVPYYAARQRNTNSYVFDESIVYDQYVYTNYPGSFVANSATDGYYQPPMNGMYQVHMECIANGSGNILIQRRTGTTVDISHDERHFNYTQSGWMSTSADALIPITNCVTQNIRIYIDGTGGDGAWQYNTYHGSAFFLWVSDIPERRQHHVA